MFQTILFPVDRSRETREAVETVVDLARKYDSRLTLLAAIEGSETDSGEAEGEPSPQQAATELLQGYQHLLGQYDLEAETLQREGMPSFAICDVADEIGAELIVMGCRGVGISAEELAESVSNRVINFSPCPVLVIP